MRRILCVIDYQVDFVTGSMGSPAADAIAPALETRIREYLSRGDAVVFTRDMHTSPEYEESCEGRHIPVRHCMAGTPGCKIDPRIAPLSEGCRIFDKTGFGSFELGDYLRNAAPDSIELAGVATNICVLSNAVIARTAVPGARVFVDRSCVASYDDGLAKAALDVLASVCVDVI